MKILVLTDSVALPRRVPEFILFSETWPELLRTVGNIVFQCSIGGATSSQLQHQCYYYNADCYNIDCVIVQCGIVDCAPRFLHRSEVEFLKGIPRLGLKVIKMLNNNWVRQVRSITYTDKQTFIDNIVLIKKAFDGIPVYFIGIIPATAEYEKALTGVSKSIEEYNQILEANAEVIKVDGIEQFGVMSDHHHLNSAGHKFIFHKIAERLKKQAQTQ